jgi:hypothetical protein
MTPEDNTIADQALRNYAVHGRVFDQIIALQGQIGGLINLYMLVTGAVWAVLAPNTFNLPVWVIVLGLVLHIAASLAVLVGAMGMANAIYHRLEFLRDLGQQYYQPIEAIGQRVYNRLHGDGFYQRFNLGRQRWIYMTVPVIGTLGSAALCIDVSRLPEHKEAVCDARREQLLKARDRIALDRAKYLLDKAGCDLKMKP